MASMPLPPATAASSGDPTTSTTGNAPRVGASPASMAALSRRGILGAIVAAPFVAAPAVAAAAIAGTSDFARAHARYIAHRDHINDGHWVTAEQEDVENEAYIKSLCDLRAAKPTTWAEFVQAFTELAEGDEDEAYLKLLADARRLAGVR